MQTEQLGLWKQSLPYQDHKLGERREALSQAGMPQRDGLSAPRQATMAKPAPDWGCVPCTAASAKHCRKMSERDYIKIEQKKALQKAALNVCELLKPLQKV